MTRGGVGGTSGWETLPWLHPIRTPQRGAVGVEDAQQGLQAQVRGRLDTPGSCAALQEQKWERHFPCVPPGGLGWVNQSPKGVSSGPLKPRGFLCFLFL